MGVCSVAMIHVPYSCKLSNIKWSQPFLLNENQLIMWEERFETCAMSCSHSAYTVDATVYMYFDTRGMWVLTINYRKKHDLHYLIFDRFEFYSGRSNIKWRSFFCLFPLIHVIHTTECKYKERNYIVNGTMWIALLCFVKYYDAFFCWFCCNVLWMEYSFPFTS